MKESYHMNECIMSLEWDMSENTFYVCADALNGQSIEIIEWVVSHEWMSHVTEWMDHVTWMWHVSEHLLRVHRCTEWAEHLHHWWVMSHEWMGHVTGMWHVWEHLLCVNSCTDWAEHLHHWWVMSHEWVSHVTWMNVSCHLNVTCLRTPSMCA